MDFSDICICTPLLLQIWRAGELFFARIRIGAQISESQYEILKSVVEGETDDDVITKCDKVVYLVFQTVSVTWCSP